MAPHRRTVLRCTGVAVAATVAGCGDRSAVQPGIGDLRFDAAVVESATAESPATVVLRIENTADTPVTVGPAGQGAGPFEYVAPLTGERGEVLLLPLNSRRVNLHLGERTNEGACWRVVDADDGEAYRSRVSLALPVEIPAGDQHAVRHAVYYHGPPDVCLPPDDYRTTVGIAVGTGDEDAFSATDERELSCTLRVGRNGSLAVELT